MASYHFGFLMLNCGLTFNGGEITPIEDFDSNQKMIAEWEHEDGFVYPPITHRLDKNGDAVPNTERQAHLYRLPASHLLQLHSDDSSDPRRTRASCVIHLLASLKDTCLQFADWWFDARVPTGRRHAIFCPQDVTEDFLSRCFAVWSAWPEAERKRLLNSLFMLNRAPAYEWDWERFAVEYMVVDALYRTAANLHLMPVVRKHEERIDGMCQAFGLMRNESQVAEFVKLRNDLVHETLWDGGRPGTAVSGSAILAPVHLHSLNRRLVLAVLGYHNEYMRSAWWAFGNVRFDPPC
jgi:hypothetical protein